MKVEIWSDVVCPWCYIGKRRFEAALAQFAQRDQVERVGNGGDESEAFDPADALQCQPVAGQRLAGDERAQLAGEIGVA